LLIRPLQPTDFGALAAYVNALAPNEPPVTAQALQAKERAAAHKRRTGLVIALDERAIVAIARYSEARSLEDRPGTFWLYFSTLPDYRTAAIFDALYHGLLTRLAPYQPTALLGMVREDDPLPVAFFQRQAFDEKLRSFGANLDLATFEPSAYATAERALAAQGIIIKSYAELADDPLRDRKLYDLHQETMVDVPNRGHFDVETFDEYVANHLRNQAMIPAAYFIATQDERYLGVSELFAGSKPDHYETKSTAVKRTHRRLGIALALKVRALTYAKTYGGTTVATGMAANNIPIVTLNHRLGFVPEPMWITFVRQL